MDKNPIVSKINNVFPGVVLESRRFGRSDSRSIWIEAQSIHKVAGLLRFDPEISLDWLENLSVVEFTEALVVTYFLQSRTDARTSLILRVSVAPPDTDAEVVVPSIRAIWPMGIPMEQEVHEMFGVRFKVLPVEKRVQSEFDFEKPLSRRLPEETRGFPLRKKFLK